MAVVHRDARVVFLATPHTASRAVSQALSGCGGEPSPKHHDTLAGLVAAGSVARHELTDFVVVTCVRNHFDALVSWWYSRGRGRSFRSFLLLLTTIEDQVREDRLYWKWFDSADLILRYEDLETQLGDLLERRLGVRPSLPRVGVHADKGDWREHYTPELRSLVEEVFSQELRDLGYSWEGASTSLAPIRRVPSWRASPT